MVAILFKCKSKMSSPQVEITADHWLEGGTCTHGGHKQFFINNFSNNTVWQFSYGGFNGEVYLLIEFVGVELFKWKGKMSAPQIRCRSPAGGRKMKLGRHHQFFMKNSIGISTPSGSGYESRDSNISMSGFHCKVDWANLL